MLHQLRLAAKLSNHCASKIEAQDLISGKFGFCSAIIVFQWKSSWVKVFGFSILEALCCLRRSAASLGRLPFAAVSSPMTDPETILSDQVWRNSHARHAHHAQQSGSWLIHESLPCWWKPPISCWSAAICLALWLPSNRRVGHGTAFLRCRACSTGSSHAIVSSNLWHGHRGGGTFARWKPNPATQPNPTNR